MGPIMNEKDFIPQLASRARMERHPSPDVAWRVMLVLNNLPEQTANIYNRLVWMARFSILAAICAGVLTLAAYQPLVYLLESLYFDQSWILSRLVSFFIRY
jgi:hypothetical protein